MGTGDWTPTGITCGDVASSARCVEYRARLLYSASTHLELELCGTALLTTLRYNELCNYFL